MRRVVITGIGIVSSIGNSADRGRGLACGPANPASSSPPTMPSTASAAGSMASRTSCWKTISTSATCASWATARPIPSSPWIRRSRTPGCPPADVSNDRTGIIVGSGGPSTKSFFKAHNIVRETGAPKRIGPFGVTKGMSSTVSACLATPFKIRGVNYSITSACSTSAHCIGNGTELIQMGKQDIVFAGGGEELDWTLSCLFDAMGAMSSKYNDAPETAVAHL